MTGDVCNCKVSLVIVISIFKCKVYAKTLLLIKDTNELEVIWVILITNLTSELMQYS